MFSRRCFLLIGMQTNQLLSNLANGSPNEDLPNAASLFLRCFRQVFICKLGARGYTKHEV